MSERRPRLVSTHTFRNAATLLLLLMALDLLLEIPWWVAQLGFDHYALKWNWFLGPVVNVQPLFADSSGHFTQELFTGATWLKFGLAIFFTILLCAWLYSAMRNLRAMGLHSLHEARVMLVSWFVFPLTIATFPTCVLHVVDKNARLYALLGKKNETGIWPARKYHQAFVWAWGCFWLGLLLLFLNIPLLFADGIADTQNAATATSIVLSSLFHIAPLLLAARFLLRFGKLEDAVLRIAESGALERWREQKLPTGRVNADHSGRADWYLEPAELVLDTEDPLAFQEQPDLPNNHTRS